MGQRGPRPDCGGGLISENHAWVFLIILGLKVEINLHLFAFYPRFPRLCLVLALLSFLADLRVSSQDLGEVCDLMSSLS